MLDDARLLDQADPLASFRERFVFDDPELIYLDGNSLGRLPKATAELTGRVVSEQWGRELIGSWNEHWFDLPRRIGARIAPVIGAAPDEVVVADSTSVNLFKLALAGCLARPERYKIVTDDLNFPSDVYVLQSVAELAGAAHHVEMVPSPDGITVPLERLAAAIDDDTALVALSHTAFKSAFVHDLAAVTEAAHRRGALVLWDLSHSAGAVPVGLNAAGADLAVGCTYKYLNGGPGAPAYLYVRRDWQSRLRNPVAGWFGRADPFRFALGYEPLPDVRRFLTGTPPILSLAAVEPGAELVLEAGVEAIREKSVRQTEYLISHWKARLAPLGYALNSPRDSDIRGSHVSLGHPEGFRINRALIEHFRVIPDFRAPDNIRLGIAPLYTTYTEIRRAVEALAQAVEERIYEQFPATRDRVT